ncbi:hypothetical protein [Roseivirga sp.]|uniref:hypothetical protein n=1 Tax=Roseivirga sp. TaxID=1964215 RepID=UPI002B278E5E|nr:hypothetical protein [Roseivirga sp.]
MQWSKTFMALLILFFSLTPCAEGWGEDNCANESGIHAESEPIDSHQEADTCTPFCACACCHIPLITVYVFPKMPENDPPGDFLVEVSGSITPPLFEIWHPPKI